MDADATLETTIPSGLPWTVSAAMERAAAAERELDRVYPLFATKLETEERTAGGSHAALELQAFVSQLRLSHRAALHALHVWSTGRGEMDAVEAAYASLAVLIERFVTRAQLDAIELD
jgi:hypothetical protein